MKAVLHHHQLAGSLETVLSMAGYCFGLGLALTVMVPSLTASSIVLLQLVTFSQSYFA